MLSGALHSKWMGLRRRQCPSQLTYLLPISLVSKITPKTTTLLGKILQTSLGRILTHSSAVKAASLKEEKWGAVSLPTSERVMNTRHYKFPGGSCDQRAQMRITVSARTCYLPTVPTVTQSEWGKSRMEI